MYRLLLMYRLLWSGCGDIRRIDGEVVEGGHAVGLRPEPHAARGFERVVVDYEEMLAVDEHLKARTPGNEAKLAPLPGGDIHHLAIRKRPAPLGLQVNALPLLDFVEHDIVLERVGAHDVVVVLVLIAPNNAARLVNCSGDGLKSDADIDVGGTERFVDGDGKAIVCLVATGLRENSRRAGCGPAT